jgi:hypothetical protein
MAATTIAGHLLSVVRVEKGAIKRAANAVRIGRWLHPVWPLSGSVLLGIIVIFAASENPAVAVDIEKEAKSENVLILKNIAVAPKAKEIGSFCNGSEPAPYVRPLKKIETGSGCIELLGSLVWSCDNSIGHRSAALLGRVDSGRDTTSVIHRNDAGGEFQNMGWRSAIIGKAESQFVERDVSGWPPIDAVCRDFYDDKRSFQFSERAFCSLGTAIVSLPQSNSGNDKKEIEQYKKPIGGLICRIESCWSASIIGSLWGFIEVVPVYRTVWRQG